MPNSTNKLLFLCTWNYYRSRFAEIYFNWEAYWDIHDVDASTPEEQLPLLRAKVCQLFTELVGF